MLFSNLTFDDSSIFIGFISSSVSEPVRFYKEQVSKLFSNYKTDLINAIPTNRKPHPYIDEYRKFFYMPRVYHIFGEFDLAILSLVDDFEFGSRTFTPFDPKFFDNYFNSKNRYYHNSFAHQIVIGGYPLSKHYSSLIEAAKDTFLSNDRLPLICISRLKLSNTYLISYGIQFIQAIINILYSKIFSYQKKHKNKKIKIIIHNSYAWNELTLIIFSNSYSSIFDILPEIREITFKHLKEYNEKESISNNFLSNNGSLFNELLSNTKNNSIELHHPLIKNSTSILGFDNDIFEELASKDKNKSTPLFDKILDEDRFCPITRWFTRGGHLSDAIKELYKNEIPSEIQICSGRGDLFYPFGEQTSIPTKEFLKKLVSLINRKSAKDHILSVFTTPTIKIDSKKIIKNKGVEPYKEDYFKSIEEYRSKIKTLEIPLEEIRTLHIKLKTSGLSKVVIENILNIIADYNHGIEDPNLYSNFIELHPFIRYIFYIFDNPHEYLYNKTILNNFLEVSVRSFEHAYNNRYHLSYSTGEITDFNVYYKGGIQQLCTVYDGFFKVVSESFGNANSFVYVEGRPNINMNLLTLGLNFFHIFNPSMLLTSAFNESALNVLVYKTLLSDLDYNIIVKYTTLNDNSIAEISSSMKKNHKLFKIFSKKYNELLLDITPQFFNHVLSDIITFQIAYNSDFELFDFWFWGYFLQTPMVYNSHKEIDSEYFRIFLMRILFVIRLESNEDFFSSYNTPFEKDLHNNLKKWLQSTKNFINLLLENKDFNKWFQEVKKLSLNLYNNCYSPSSEKIGQVGNYNIEYIKNHIKHGKVISYSINEDESQSCIFVQRVLYSYLKLIKTEFYNNSNYKYLLNRRVTDGQPVISKEDGKILFDPLGGLFMTDLEVRRKLFKYRNALIFSLWDMSVKRKYKYILDNINKN